VHTPEAVALRGHTVAVAVSEVSCPRGSRTREDSNRRTALARRTKEIVRRRGNREDAGDVWVLKTQKDSSLKGQRDVCGAGVSRQPNSKGERRLIGRAKKVRPRIPKSTRHGAGAWGVACVSGSQRDGHLLGKAAEALILMAFQQPW